MAQQTLQQITRGDHSAPYTVGLTREGSPALDVTLQGTVVKFRASLPNTTGILFEKTIGDGVTVDGPNQVTVVLVPADTASITSVSGKVVLDVEIKVIEADGRVTTPWFGQLPVRMDLA